MRERSWRQSALRVRQARLGIKDDEAAERQAAEIAATNRLVEEFNHYAADWEALEVRYSLLQTLIILLRPPRARLHAHVLMSFTSPIRNISRGEHA